MVRSMMLADSRQFSSSNYENAGAFAQGFHFSFPCADGLGNDAFVFRVEVFGDAKQHVLGQVFAKELQQSIGAIGGFYEQMAVFVCGLVVEQCGELFDFIFIDRWVTVKSESLTIQSTSGQRQHQAVWSHDGFNVPPTLVC